MDLVPGVIASLIAETLFAAILFVIGRTFWDRVRDLVLRAIIPRALRDAGFRNGYANTRDALPRITEAIQQSSTVWIMSNRGEDWIGPDKADLTKCIESKRNQISHLYVLLLDPEAPWLVKWSHDKGRNLDDVKRKFHSSHLSVESFVRTNLFKERPRYHTNDPVWRFIMTDRALFLSSYATPGEARDGPIIEFDRASPFYAAAKRYFKFLWDNAAPGANSSTPVRVAN